MRKMTARANRKKERGMALLLTLFALLLLSAIGLFMVLSSDTETRINANYGSSLKAYYSAKSGLEEVRDRVKYPSTVAGGLSDLLPQDVAGNAKGVLYILNPANGESVDPTDITSPYFDDQLCHDYNSGSDKGIKCNVVPTAANWRLPSQAAQVPGTGPLGYKWVRINMKTNRIADPYFVDQTGTSAPLDTRVCWDGQTEQLSVSSVNPACDANGMQTVYMLTSLAATPQPNGPTGAKKLLRVEVVAPAIRPPGALTMGASVTAPVLTSGAGIPSVAVDGRVHKLDGTLATGNSCSAIAPLATDTPAGTLQTEQALNQVRLGIVQSANNSCKADGSGLNGNICTPGLWWVRGTDTDTRFITSDSGSSGSTGTSGSTSTNGLTAADTSGSSDLIASDNSGPGSDSSRHRGRDGDGDGDHHHDDPSGIGNTGACDSANSACYTNLDLAAPELMAISAITGQHLPTVTVAAGAPAPFRGSRGNQADATVYQPAVAQIIQNEMAAVNNLVATSVNKPNYFSVSSGNLAASYGTSTDPAIVVFNDSTLTLQSGMTLTGYGVLVVQNALEINGGTLRWNGIVLVQSSTGHVNISQGATGYVNGALLIQPGAAVNVQSNAGLFSLMYSCEAVDLPFSAQPMKIISTAETSF